MDKLRNSVDILPHERYGQTDNRRQTDRRTGDDI